MVIELLKGPAGETPPQRLLWLKRVHFACASATEGSIAKLAEPLKRATELCEALDTPSAPADAEQQLAGCIVQVQGLALYVYLEELNRVRNMVAAEAAKMKAGTPEHKKSQQLQGAYEQAIDNLARAYNGLRSGKLDELKLVAPAMEQVRKIAAELAK